MSETSEQFYNRIYVNGTREKVWVYPRVRGKGKPAIWTIEQARQYLNYLERNQNAE